MGEKSRHGKGETASQSLDSVFGKGREKVVAVRVQG